MTINDLFMKLRDDLPEGSVFRREALIRLFNRDDYDLALDRPYELWYNDVVREGAAEISFACGTFEEFRCKVDEFYLYMERVYRECWANAEFRTN